MSDATFKRVIGSAVAAVFLSTPFSIAAVTNYTGNSSAAIPDGDLANPQNFDNGAPTAIDIANFPGRNTAPAQSPIIKSDVSVLGITIDNTGTYKYSLPRGGDNATPRTLSIGESGITIVGAGDVQLGGIPTTLTAAQTFTIGADATLSITGGSLLAGSNKLTKAGAGSLVFNNVASPFSGGIDVTGGLLAFGASTNQIAVGSLVQVYDGAVFEARNLLTGNAFKLYNGSTLRGNGSGNGLGTGQTLSLDTAAGTSVTFSTVAAGDNLVLSRAIAGGAADSVITIAGPGFTTINDQSGTTYAGRFVITGGQVRANNANIFNGKAVELAGGTLRYAFTPNGSATQTTGTTTTISANSGLIIERSSTAFTGDTTRIAGPLAVNGSTVTVRTGDFLNGAQTARLQYSSLTLTGTPTFDIANGVSTASTGSQAVGLQLINAGTTTGGANGINKIGNGQLRLNGAATYSGPTTVGGGTLAFGTVGTLTSSLFNIASGATLELNNGASGAWNTAADLSGSGTVSLNVSGASLRLDGSDISPGGDNASGILTITTGTTNLQKLAGVNASLKIDVTGGGAVAGTDHDRLSLAALSNLANASLVVNISGLLSNADLAGDMLTILTTTTNISSSTFGAVTFVGGSGTVTYNTNSITLSNLTVPEPTALAGLALAGMLLAGRRRRS